MAVGWTDTGKTMDPIWLFHLVSTADNENEQQELANPYLQSFSISHFHFSVLFGSLFVSFMERGCGTGVLHYFTHAPF